MKSKILEWFGLAVKDKTPDEIARMAQDAAAAMDEEAAADPPAKDPDKDSPAKDGNPFEGVDDTVLDGLLEKLLARKAAKEAAEKDGDPMEKAIAALAGEGVESEEAHVVPAEEMDKGAKENPVGMDKAVAAGILKAMRPVVAAIKDEKQRTAVADALIQCVTVPDGASDIAKIMEAAKNNAQKAADARPNQQKILDDVQASYDALNPHKTKKEER